MKIEMTETELITEVGKFYSNSLYLEKAMMLYEMEYGYRPEIVEPKNIINQEFVDSMGFPECVTAKALIFMKELQEGGTVNMFASSGHIQQALMVDRQTAKEILMTYIKYYTEIYYPENAL